ncbi:hypothetical protein KUCAC02_000979 [Chaenocephalus aceratus]|uniref:Uncharacterized protein n=1 Tax=Chaenocephalus aceratus TaxID=36190 RepID=A0ACB9XVM1_CHAAC|nr:hypothetical protein KUCAC02_000979 [Chaenocephalus aceratus]
MKTYYYTCHVAGHQKQPQPILGPNLHMYMQPSSVQKYSSLSGAAHCRSNLSSPLCLVPPSIHPTATMSRDVEVNGEELADERTDGGISNPRSACILLNHGTAWACLQRRDREREGERGREADEETRGCQPVSKRAAR